MEFIRGVIGRAGGLPLTVGERIDHGETMWAVHNGLKEGNECTVFIFDGSKTKSKMILAKNALRKLRTIRHPGILSYLDSHETETHVYIATERITLLHLAQTNVDINKWGLYCISSALKFLHSDAASVHGNVRVSSIFVSRSGEWKLGGLELLSARKGEDAVLERSGGMLSESHKYAAPEIGSKGWSAASPALDSWQLGCLVYEVFNGLFSNPAQLNQPKAVPNDLSKVYLRLVQPNPKMRISPSAFLTQGLKSFFQTDLIHCSEFLNNIGIKSTAEREAFLDSMARSLGEFPLNFLSGKVLPELLNSFEFGNGGTKVLGSILSIGEKISLDEFSKALTPSITRTFASQDKQMRHTILESFPKLTKHLEAKAISTSIFPEFVGGFADPLPFIREATVKSVLALIPHLSDRQKNNELLKGLSRTQSDDQPGIRTNTTICLGKIAGQLSPQTRSKVLVAAFSRSLKDPFVHARNASLMAIAATLDVYSMEDCAIRLLPSTSPLLIDKEKVIRSQASVTTNGLLNRVKTLTASMVEPVTSAPPSSSSTPKIGTSGEGWSYWGISSLRDKVETVGNGVLERVVDNSERPHSAPSGKNDSTSSTSRPVQLRPDTNGTHSNQDYFAPAEDDAEDCKSWEESNEGWEKATNTERTHGLSMKATKTLNNPFAEDSLGKLAGKSSVKTTRMQSSIVLEPKEESNEGEDGWDAWDA